MIKIETNELDYADDFRIRGEGETRMSSVKYHFNLNSQHSLNHLGKPASTSSSWPGLRVRTYGTRGSKFLKTIK